MRNIWQRSTIILAILLSGCAPASGNVSDLCLIDKPLTYHDDDTAETRRQIMIWDAQHADLCGW